MIAVETEAQEDERLRKKRIQTLEAAFEQMKKSWNPDPPIKLHDPFVAATVEHYIIERKAVKLRYNIPGKIQRHKVAGLMAKAIISLRPIQIESSQAVHGVSNSFDNEYFAVFHGLAICAEGCEDGKIDQLIQAPEFANWCEDFVDLMRWRVPGQESLIHIFHTLCLAYFPENLRHDCTSD